MFQANVGTIRILALSSSQRGDRGPPQKPPPVSCQTARSVEPVARSRWRSPVAPVLTDVNPDARSSVIDFFAISRLDKPVDPRRFPTSGRSRNSRTAIKALAPSWPACAGTQEEARQKRNKRRCGASAWHRRVGMIGIESPTFWIWTRCEHRVCKSVDKGSGTVSVRFSGRA